MLRGESDEFVFDTPFLWVILRRLRDLEKEDRVFQGGHRSAKQGGSLLTDFAKALMHRLKIEVMREERWRLPIFEDTNLESLVTHEECKKFVRVVRGYLRWRRRQSMMEAVRVKVARVRRRFKRTPH